MTATEIRQLRDDLGEARAQRRTAREQRDQARRDLADEQRAHELTRNAMAAELAKVTAQRDDLVRFQEALFEAIQEADG